MKIIIINSRGGCGKDTFVNYCQELIGEQLCHNISTVDYVKSLAQQCGWDGGKTPEERKFLADLKQLLTNSPWGNVPFDKTCKVIDGIAATMDSLQLDTDNLVIFVHCREPEQIQKFVDRYKAITLLVRRPQHQETYLSAADNNVEDYHYDFIIDNGGSLENLRREADYFLNTIGITWRI